MLNQLTSPTERTCFQNIHPTLPKMASLFINELLVRQTDDTRNAPGWIQSTKRSKTVRVPLDQHQPFPRQEKKEVRKPPRYSSTGTANLHRKAASRTSVRILIKGISHHFNNLLMGIWGNLSLMRMTIDDGHPATHWLNEMEALIQDGAYLTHLILGYLGERRVYAQRIRLKQLSKEIHVLLEKKKTLGELIGRLEWVTLSQQPSLVTGSTGIIFQQFLEGIRTVCRNLDTAPYPNDMYVKRLACVNALIDRGLNLTHQMRCSTGNVRNKKRWINLHHVVKQLLNTIVWDHPEVKITHSASPTIPLVLADRALLMQAVRQILDNACNCVPAEGGRVDINVNMLQEETPKERCGVHSIGNCLVLTIRDNGTGIPSKAQPRIFEPFNTCPGNKSSVGLGLAVAKGIVRSLGGYIKVQSTVPIGSVFKIYLPVG